jgi:hypothetical protein
MNNVILLLAKCKKYAVSIKSPFSVVLININHPDQWAYQHWDSQFTVSVNNVKIQFATCMKSNVMHLPCLASAMFIVIC